MRKLPLIVVEWEDASTENAWKDGSYDFAGNTVNVISVGWKIKSGKRHIVLTPMRSSLNHYSDTQIIPKGCIKSIRRVE